MRSFISVLAFCAVCSMPLYAQIDDKEGSATFVGVGAIKSSPWETAYSVNQFVADHGAIISGSLYFQPDFQAQSFNRYYFNFGYGKIYPDVIYLHPFWNLGVGFRVDEHKRKNKSWYEFNSFKNWRVGPSAEVGLLKSYSFAENKVGLAVLLMFSSYLLKDGVVLMPSASIGLSYTISL